MSRNNLRLHPQKVTVEAGTDLADLVRFIEDQAELSMRECADRYDEPHVAVDRIRSYLEELKRALDNKQTVIAVAAAWTLALWCADPWRKHDFDEGIEQGQWQKNEKRRSKVKTGVRREHQAADSVEVAFKQWRALVKSNPVGSDEDIQARKIVLENNPRVTRASLRQRISRYKKLIDQKLHPQRQL